MTPSVCCQRRQPLATAAGRPDDLSSSCESHVFAHASEIPVRFVYALRSSSLRFAYALRSLHHSAVNTIVLAAIKELLPKIETHSISLEIEGNTTINHGRRAGTNMAARSNMAIRIRRAWQFELGGRGNSYSDAAILKQRMRQLTWQFVQHREGIEREGIQQQQKYNNQPLQEGEEGGDERSGGDGDGVGDEKRNGSNINRGLGSNRK